MYVSEVENINLQDIRKCHNIYEFIFLKDIDIWKNKVFIGICTGVHGE
jgi:hypothetical protein